MESHLILPRYRVEYIRSSQFGGCSCLCTFTEDLVKSPPGDSYCQPFCISPSETLPSDSRLVIETTGDSDSEDPSQERVQRVVVVHSLVFMIGGCRPECLRSFVYDILLLYCFTGSDW